jgi:type VI secretion system protein VasD
MLHSNPHADITFKSANYLNPDMNGRPSPVVVTLYQLKSAYTFKQADAASLMADSAKILGGDLIDKNTIEIRPNNTKTINQALDPDVQYLGIVADYRNATTESWHKVVKLDSSGGERADITINLESQGFSVQTN